jgi:hypothetical protein
VPSGTSSRLALRVGQDAFDRLLHRLGPVAFDELGEAPLGDVQGGDLGLQVAPVLARDAGVGQDQVELLLVRLAAPVQLRRRDDEALLVLVDRGRADAARYEPADVGGVDEREAEAQQPTVSEDRLPHEVVGQVGDEPLRAFRIVRDADVARLVAGDRLDRAVHRCPDADEDPHVVGRHEDLAAATDQIGAEVGGLLHEDRVAGNLDRVPELARDPHEAVLEDL